MATASDGVDQSSTPFRPRIMQLPSASHRSRSAIPIPPRWPPRWPQRWTRWFTHPALTAVLVSVVLWPLQEERVRAVQAAETVTVRFRVSVPDGTPRDATLFLAGNTEQLGPWQPNAFALKRVDANAFVGEIELPIGFELQYKVTRGSWATVEKTLGGGEISNRIWNVREDVYVDIAVAAWATRRAVRPTSATGDLRWMEFPSRILDGNRRVTVWLPEEYASQPEMRYPVVYLLDGQNCFDASRAAFGVEWCADETARDLIERCKIRPFMMVAIDNSPNRMSEYTAARETPVSKDGTDSNPIGGGADRMLAFLADELKPKIDQTFRTRPERESTMVIGSSLGGLFVLHAVQTRGDLFGGGAAMSPSLFWANAAALRAVESWPATAATAPGTSSSEGSERAIGPQRLWIDIGTSEGKSASGQKQAVELVVRLEQLLKERVGDRLVLRTSIIPDAQHHESAWAERLPDAFLFLFPSEETP
jgi:predicted alpha/beta superfamily hydrolase